MCALFECVFVCSFVFMHLNGMGNMQLIFDRHRPTILYGKSFLEKVLISFECVEFTTDRTGGGKGEMKHEGTTNK